MRRILAILGLSIVAVLLIIVAGAGVFMATLDLNKYKGDINEALELALGRKIIVEGDIHHSLFPLGLSVSKISIHDDAKFGSDPFLEIKDAALKLNLKALFAQKLDIEEIVIDELKAKLALAPSGQGNWTFGTAAKANLDESKTALKDESKGSKEAEGFLDRFIPTTYKLQQLRIKKLQVAYMNLGDKTDLLLNFNPLILKNIAFDQPLTFAFSGFVQDRINNIRGDFELAGALKASEDIKVSLNLEPSSIIFSNPALSEISFPVNLSAKMLYTNSMGSLNINGLSLKMADTEYKGNFALILSGGANLPKDKDLDIRGDLSFATLDLTALLKQMNVFTPAKNLGRAPKGSNEAPLLLAGGTKSAEIADKTSSDSSPLRGIVAKLNIAGDALLHDNIRLDKFTAIVSLNESSPPLSPGTRAITDFDILKDVYGTVDFRAASLAVDKINISDLHLDIRLDDGIINIPYSAKAFAGTLAGTANLRLLTQPPSWHIINDASKLRAEEIMKSISSESYLSGEINNKADLQGKGLELNLPSINGTIDFSLSGASATNLMSEKDRKAAGFAKEISISEASATMKITNGIAETDNLSVKAPLGTAKGKGIVDLIQETVKMDIDIRPGGVPPEIPIHVSGKIAKPSIMIDPVRLIGKTAKGVIEAPIDIGGAILTAPIKILKQIF